MTNTPADEAPRWLDEEERRAWLGLVGIMRRLEHALDTQLRDEGLTHFEYGVMASLSESPQRELRMSALAAFAEGSLSRLSQVVARLERKRYVQRRPDPADGRYTLATLTDEGYEKIVSAAPGHVAEVRRLVLDPLTKAQVKQLAHIGRRILHAIDPDHCDGGRGLGPP
ncbi:MarR family winged helix-turn-helix transcriptional regulator [Streptomyces sp. NL15-2K]|uniref:MarR family winged helix-turn-helix transcriptional regulator n=1 Tax=Streptomyces sp. NL15-2K TaxID=376149 RepID=UPI000F58D41D|nr:MULTISPECIES: MarR family transcriptional regulator [Actinomycetes]WKX12263.1 MarR family transcriptional regulator [Kutzneria buriramensis]GCB46237.1 marR family transcriptional regulator [Streptomyces sp. NL15-2K]